MAIESDTIQIDVGEDCTVNVTVAEVTDLFSWQAIIVYNHTILNFTGARLPPGNVFDGKTPIFPDPLSSAINETSSYCMIGASMLLGEPFNGTGILCEVEFTGISLGESTLHLALEPVMGRTSKLEDSEGNPIAFDISDGYIVVIPEFPSFLIAPLLILATIVAVIIGKRLRQEEKSTHNYEHPSVAF